MPDFDVLITTLKSFDFYFCCVAIVSLWNYICCEIKN